MVATWGPDLGREATVDALVHGWRHWQKVREMENPVGYLYVVGKNSVRPLRPDPALRHPDVQDDPWVEPGLEQSLLELSVPQRTVVTLHHSFAWTYQEIADLLDIKVSTVRNHLDRGMKKLRNALGVFLDA